MLLIHCGSEYIPELESVYNMKSNWRVYDFLGRFPFVRTGRPDIREQNSVVNQICPVLSVNA